MPDGMGGYRPPKKETLPGWELYGNPYAYFDPFGYGTTPAYGPGMVQAALPPGWGGYDLYRPYQGTPAPPPPPNTNPLTGQPLRPTGGGGNGGTRTPRKTSAPSTTGANGDGGNGGGVWDPNFYDQYGGWLAGMQDYYRDRGREMPSGWYTDQGYQGGLEDAQGATDDGRAAYYSATYGKGPAINSGGRIHYSPGDYNYMNAVRNADYADMSEDQRAKLDAFAAKRGMSGQQLFDLADRERRKFKTFPWMNNPRRHEGRGGKGGGGGKKKATPDKGDGNPNWMKQLAQLNV